MNRRPRRLENGFVLSHDLTPHRVPLAELKPLGRATRRHPPQQVRKLAASLERFGFVLPILIDPDRRVVAGSALVMAAQQLGLDMVPVVTVADLPDGELRSLRIALNRITEDAGWDPDALALEFSEILELAPQLELDVTGFEMAEIDILLEGDGADEEDDLPVTTDKVAPVTRVRDLWDLGDHRLLCADALEPDSYSRVLGTDKVDMMFTDPPYNVPIDGHVSGLGATKHADFVQGSGELSPAEFQSFLSTALGHAAGHSRNGAIHFVCMDWRHSAEILAAGRQIYTEFKNLCVWNKSNAGMGSLYRSKHELVFVFKVGKAAHTNNIVLGQFGRHRTNVWDYPSQNTLNRSAKGKLALHPTVKPVAMIADAMRDCSNRGGLILDPFGGAGTTLISAERTGRRARVIELDPTFVDVSVERWQRLTGRTAVHADDGRPFQRPEGMAAADTGEGDLDGQA